MVSADEFRQALSRWSTGVTVIAIVLVLTALNLLTADTDRCSTSTGRC